MAEEGGEGNRSPGGRGGEKTGEVKVLERASCGPSTASSFQKRGANTEWVGKGSHTRAQLSTSSSRC